MTSSGPVQPEDGWRARVSETDIRAARTAWWEARERGDSPDRVTELWGELVRLFRAEAEQIAREFWLGRSGRDVDVPRPRRGDRILD